MLQSLLKIIDNFYSVPTVYAHCDIPCGIYDPHNMQMAAHTVIRMTSLIQEYKIQNDSEQSKKEFAHMLSRYTKVKEEHAELVKHELRVLWADYFKPEHVKDYHDLHELVFRTMKLASKSRQEINLEIAQKLLENTQKIAEIFYRTKGMESVRIASGYPTGGEVVSHR